MRKDVVFRGCTRPPMFLGVPYIPFFVGAGSVLLLAMYSGQMLFLLFIPVVVFVMRAMAKRDEMIFRLLGLKLQMRFKVKNIPEHDGLWVFTPNNHRGQPEIKRGR